MRRSLGLCAALIGVSTGCELAFTVEGSRPDAPPPECDELLDEDGDAVLDCDDNCPGEPNADQDDTDVPPDGIGDACDPHRNDPFDLVARRYFFYAGRELDGWVANADWAPCAGCMTTVSADASPLITAEPLGYTDEITVEVGVVLKSPSGPLPRRAGAWIDGTTVATGLHRCALDERDGDPAVVPLVVVGDGGASETLGSNVDVAVYPLRATIQFTRRSMPTKLLSCEVRTADARVDAPPLIPTDLTPTGSFGVDGFHAEVEVHHVIVYAVPNQ